ncbi:2-nitropropane dioxygenase [Actinoplanes philippinensis]|uniref:NAD(P)H-dependent flavin oxidoreductase YrpB, nitropropane dioxygenase family n=1 Tax=Actinoplanes philippinensis TaxID=35752 RepID=A0A1I2M6K1_9ACTN|nr:nitronate monooxygenase [Actinoplanes philippinensis]GIE83069.1 2-nitropropane dioxygenase [Actinoplanes philippinensis]SFF87084.1 NAD(P)H-dependent flavin oxidoreductase YrpB, nitropropane dioxygenase family [Actinoplanes philippinensis]
MQITTRLTDEYGLRTPIVQAGMAFVGMTPDLAVAVSNAGAMGSLGVGLMPPPAVTATIAAIRAGTGGPFHVNVITPFTTGELIDALCAAAVPAVSFHWGHPSPEWIDRLHAAGARVFEQVGSVEAARRAAGDGVDVIVAQGAEAGGHNFATLPTFALVPLVVDAVAPALVLAAGGVADGRGLAAALMLGADGVWVGTRLVATAESAAHDGYKERLVAAQATATVRTSLFGPETPDFNPMRVLRNRVVEEHPHGGGDRPVIGHTVLGGEEIELRRYTNLVPMRDVTTGDLEEMPLLSGQGVGLVGAVEPAGTVIADMTATAAALLSRWTAAVA